MKQIKTNPAAPLTVEQLQAVEAFRVKYSDRRQLRRLGCADWVEALQQAWQQGWDAGEPNGGHLRRLRNTPEAMRYLMGFLQPLTSTERQRLRLDFL